MDVDRLVEVRPGGPNAVMRRPPHLGTALVESIRLHLGADVPTGLLVYHAEILLSRFESDR
jgi:hypothetical protein